MTKAKQGEAIIRDMSIITVTFHGSTDANGHMGAKVEWWDEDQARWRSQAFRMVPLVLIGRLEKDYPGRTVESLRSTTAR